MSFGGFFFMVFVAVTWAVHRIAPERFRTPVLVIASYAFYAAASPAHALLLLALTVIVWGCSLKITSSANPRWWLHRGIAVIIVVLAVFKYTDMVVGTVNTLGGKHGAERLWIPEIVAPLGLSFVSFMLISYLVEVHRGAPAASLRELTLFAAFFPTVVSGPIKRWLPFREDLGRNRLPDSHELASACGRVLIGAAKKFVVADSLVVSTRVLSEPMANHPFTLFVAVYLVALWIYFDFSGYTDMAIGVARLFGFRVPENFNWPYLQRNLSEFWGHWHMSLTRFLTEYVFIPLGGSRCGLRRTIINTLAVMTLSGLWHGAAWHFVAWGFLHGAGLVGLRLFGKTLDAARQRWAWLQSMAESTLGQRIGHGLSVAVTFNFVAAAWVLFVLPVGQSYLVYKRIAWGAWQVIKGVV